MSPQEKIDLSLENRLSEEEWAGLQEVLLSDSTLMESYVQQRWLHAGLLGDSSLFDRLEPAPNTSPRPSSAPWGLLAAAALIALLGIVSFIFSRQPADDSVATLIEAENCRWEGSDLPTLEGARLGPGTLALAEGMATIRFESGAVVTLEAPTVLEVESAMRCRLIEGSVVADVPDSAHGFTIDTEKMEVIDLGTRFGVTSTPVGGSHVFVFEGEVKVRRDDEDKPQHILSGNSMHLGAPHENPDQEVTRKLPESSSLSDWFPVSTSLGRGKDAYIRRTDSSGRTGGDPLLMVKHTDLAPGNERRALLTFDLARLDRATMQEAKLTLMMESSGLGFSSLVPDSSFTVYGALDKSLHAWDESSLQWENSPHLTGETPDPALFVPLAGFVIPKGSANGLIEISSAALSSFLLTPGEPLVTLLIVRESGEFDKQGLVHAFASKEHPGGPAPTLWFRPLSKK